jgi:hypothetical protein
MENTFKLISNRLSNLEAIIKQHKYCIKENISVDLYKVRLFELEKEYSNLKNEYEELKKYCITK